MAYQCFRMMPCAHVNVTPPIVVCGVGAAPVSIGLSCAVLDDKSKDTVKITVIATGFKDSDIRRRQQESRTGFAASRDFFEPETESEPTPPRMVMEQAATQAAPADVVAVDAVRNAVVANFEKQDLDVPAFLRKRGEVN